MTQSDIIDIVTANPGILQSEIPNRIELKERAISQNIQRLVKWNKIKRVRVKWTYALFLVG